MKVKNIKNIDGFFRLVDKCEGKVELVTSEGDRLNLKSNLCKYVALANVFANGEIDEIEIVTYNPNDTFKFIQFMMDDTVYDERNN